MTSPKAFLGKNTNEFVKTANEHLHMPLVKESAWCLHLHQWLCVYLPDTAAPGVFPMLNQLFLWLSLHHLELLLALIHAMPQERLSNGTSLHLLPCHA